MIWISFLSLVFFILNVVFGLLPSIPAMPDNFISYVDQFFDLIFSNSGIVGFFLPIDVVKVALPLVIVITNFDHIYKIIMWIVRKLPISID
ncbi:MAG: hypothetical protein MRZ42_02675 [Tenericutes bacterium]|nr:hypothetical protein [Mycoplasmatota bacterium]